MGTMLGEQLGIDLWIKRDDLSAAEYGGNKVRKLDYLLARARDQLLVWVDAARVDQRGGMGVGWPLQPGMGGGVRLTYNEVTITRLDLATGRFLADLDLADRKRVAVLGSSVAARSAASVL